MIITDEKNLEYLCWRDKNDQWWKRTGKCNRCGFCCGYGYCEYLKGGLCELRLKGLWNLQCYLGTFPDNEHFEEIQKVCGYKWTKATLKECLND
jgi:hypothetical protein